MKKTTYEKIRYSFGGNNRAVIRRWHDNPVLVSKLAKQYSVSDAEAKDALAKMIAEREENAVRQGRP